MIAGEDFLQYFLEYILLGEVREMFHTLSLNRLIPRPGAILALVVVIFLSTLWISCTTTGACLASGGVAPGDCKDGWTAAECSDWNDQGINGSTWNFHSGQTCADLGY